MDSDIICREESGQDGLRRRFRQPENFRENTLPESDRGRDAWLFLATCFMVEALIWGYW